MLISLALLSTSPLYEAPHYPPAAAEAGIEAVCDTMFDVNAEGRTENICVVCHPTQTLDHTNIAAEFEASLFSVVSQWRYQTGSGRRSVFETLPELNLGLDGQAGWVESENSPDDDYPVRREAIVTQFSFELEESLGRPSTPEPDLDRLQQCRAETIEAALR